MRRDPKVMGLNERELLSRLRVKEHGRDDGLRDMPSTNDDAPSSCEQDIQAEYVKVVDRLRRAAAKRVDTYKKEIEAQNLTAEEEDYTSPAAAAMSRAALEKASRLDRARIAREEERAQLGVLNHFKATHELEREPRRVWSVAGSWFLILSLWLGESCVYFSLLISRSIYGAFWQFLHGVAISAPLVSGSMMVGFWGLRYAFHRQRSIRIVAASLSVLGMTWLLIYLLGVSMFGALLDRGGDTRLLDGFVALFSRPNLLFGSQEGLIMLATGIVVVVLTIWRSFGGFSDPYPGYSRVHREYLRARDTYVKAREATRDGPRRAIDDAIETIKLRVKSVDAKTNNIALKSGDLRAELNRLAEELIAAAHACQAAVGVYRSENKRVRRTRAPASFDRVPPFGGSVGDEPEGLMETMVRAREKETRWLHLAAHDEIEKLNQYADALMREVEADLKALEEAVDRRQEVALEEWARRKGHGNIASLPKRESG